jgi:hypothetical protein
MSTEKAELKVLVADEIGNGLREALREAEARIHAARGAATIVAATQREIQTIVQAVVAEWKEGKVTLDPEDPVAAGKYAVDRLMAAARKVHDIGENAAQSVLRAEGEVEGMRKALRQVVDMRVREQGKADAARREEAAPLEHGGPRPPGVHPGLTLKAQRQAEATPAEAPKTKPPRKPSRSGKKTARAKDS